MATVIVTPETQPDNSSSVDETLPVATDQLLAIAQAQGEQTARLAQLETQLTELRQQADSYQSMRQSIESQLTSLEGQQAQLATGMAALVEAWEQSETEIEADAESASEAQIEVSDESISEETEQPASKAPASALRRLMFGTPRN